MCKLDKVVILFFFEMDTSFDLALKTRKKEKNLEISPPVPVRFCLFVYLFKIEYEASLHDEVL